MTLFEVLLYIVIPVTVVIVACNVNWRSMERKDEAERRRQDVLVREGWYDHDKHRIGD